MAITSAESAVDNAQLQVDIASSRGREVLIEALAKIRGKVIVLGSVLDAYRAEHAGLLDEIDGLRDELAAERSWHADVDQLAVDQDRRRH